MLELWEVDFIVEYAMYWGEMLVSGAYQWWENTAEMTDAATVALERYKNPMPVNDDIITVTTTDLEFQLIMDRAVQAHFERHEVSV